MERWRVSGVLKNKTPRAESFGNPGLGLPGLGSPRRGRSSCSGKTHEFGEGGSGVPYLDQESRAGLVQGADAY